MKSDRELYITNLVGPTAQSEMKKKKGITRTHLGSSGMASNDYRKMSNGMLERRTTDIVTTAAIRSQLLEQSDALLQPSPSSQD